MTRAATALTLLIFLASCASDSADSSATGPAHIAVVGGDAQLADAFDTLPRPVRFEVTDAHGRAMPGIHVTFVVTLGDGSVPESSAMTDAAGQVETLWFMGGEAGVQGIEAHVSTSLFATATAATCPPGECYPAARLDGPISDATLLELATYEGSGQTVHPDVVRGHGQASAFWLAITPYPGGDLSHENPSIFRSTNTVRWDVPAGAVNPLATPSAVTGYLSDPDIVFNSSDQRLWMFFRAYSPSQNVISVIRSYNGSGWDQPTVVLSAPSHQLVSPSIVRGGPHAAWVMWAVNAGPQGCSASSTTLDRRTSTDGLHWTAGVPTDLAQPGETIWHIDVEWVPARGEYWAVYNTFPTGTSCATHALYIARSTDGTHWITSPSPIARSGLIPAFADVLYRSSFLVDGKGSRVTLWMSGAAYTDQTGYVWRTASVSTTASELFGIAAIPAAGPRTAFRALPPPEADVGH